MLAGQGRRADVDAVQRLCDTIPGTTLCPTGEAFAKPIGAMVRKFRAEFDALAPA